MSEAYAIDGIWRHIIYPDSSGLDQIALAAIPLFTQSPQQIRQSYLECLFEASAIDYIVCVNGIIMSKMKSAMLLILSLTLISISQSSIAQDVDTAYFLNSSQPLMVKIEGQAYTSNTHISRVVKSTNGSDSVIIDLYWKHCLPAFNGFEPYDTIIPLDFNTPTTFDVRINSYKDTNSTCALNDSIEFLLYYDMPNNLAKIDKLELKEKQIMKVVNLMGNKTEDKSNTLLIYIYTDGTTKKVFRVN